MGLEAPQLRKMVSYKHAIVSFSPHVLSPAEQSLFLMINSFTMISPGVFNVSLSTYTPRQRHTVQCSRWLLQLLHGLKIVLH